MEADHTLIQSKAKDGGIVDLIQGTFTTRRPWSFMQSCSVSWIVFHFLFCFVLCLSFLVYIQPLWFLHSIGPSP